MVYALGFALMNLDFIALQRGGFALPLTLQIILYTYIYIPATRNDHFFLVVLKTTTFFGRFKKNGRFILQSFYT